MEGCCIITIKEKKDCTGCYACVSVCPAKCIEMVIDSEGFCYPEIDAGQCTNCRRCEKTCPIINPITEHDKPVAYAGYNLDIENRLQSSSGAIFSLLAEHVIQEYSGVVFGAAFNEVHELVHISVDNIKDLKKLYGSKYLQSRIGDTLKKAKKLLDSGKFVLFSGTPCQIAGLRAYLKKEYGNLICIDIICHGVPSPKVWKRYVSYLESKEKSTVENVSFRDKRNGWQRFNLKITFASGKAYLKHHQNDLYMKAFLKNLILRPSCYECRFKGLNRQSDITLADFWGIDTIYPDMNDGNGISLILVNSTKGKRIFNEISNKIAYREADVEKAVLHNTAAIYSCKCHSKREEFFYRLDNLSIDNLLERFCKDNMLIRIKRRLSVLKRFI